MGDNPKSVDRSAIANGDGQYSFSGIITRENGFTTLFTDSFCVANGKKRLVANGRQTLDMLTEDLQFLIESINKK